MKSEFTIEITSRCEHNCSYCSSCAEQNGPHLALNVIKNALENLGPFGLLHISGGEPLCHPDFYVILKLAYQHSKRVIVHTNAIRDIAFNPNVIDGIYVEAYLNVPETTDEVHILKRVNHGREKKKPKIKCSRNWEGECSCHHDVLRADGIMAKSPCNK